MNVLTSVPPSLPLASWEHYIIVVERDPVRRDAYRAALRAAGFAAVAVEDGGAAVRLAGTQRPSAIVAELPADRADGGDLHGVLTSNPHTVGVPIVAIAAAVDGPNLSGVACLLKRPLDVRALVVAVQHVVRHSMPHRLQ